jgi:hypothetical protein
VNRPVAVYGLTIDANCDLPGLDAAPAEQPTAGLHFTLSDGDVGAVPDLRWVTWAIPPVYEIPGTSHRIWSGTAPDGTYWRLSYGDATSRRCLDFVVHPTGQSIWAVRRIEPGEESIGLDAVTTLLVGTVLGVALRLRGVVCLHASAIAVGSRCVVITGDKGAGKSTLAASLAERGHAILADDVAAICEDDGVYGVQAGYPGVRLWPATLQALHKAAEGLPPVLPLLEKRYVSLSGQSERPSWRFHSGMMTLASIFHITRDRELSAPVVEPVSGPSRVAILAAHTPASFLRLERAAQAREFFALGRLAAQVPVLNVRCPHGLEHLPALADCLTEPVGCH